MISFAAFFRRRKTPPAESKAEALSIKHSHNLVNSTDQLEQRIIIIRHGNIVAVVGLAVLIATVLFWGVYGSIETRVPGRGIIVLEGEAQYPLQSPIGGVISRVLIKTGSSIDRNTVIFELEQPELSAQLKTARQRIDRLNKEYALLQKESSDLTGNRGDYLVDEKKALDDQAKQLQSRSSFIGDELEKRERLYRQGVIARAALERTRQSKAQVDIELSQAQTRRIELDKNYDSFLASERRRLFNFNQTITTAQAEVERIERRFKRLAMVLSPIEGIVEEIYTESGAVISPGTTLALAREEGVKGYEALSFVSAFQGKRINLGMEVRIMPSTVSPEDHGSMMGRVVDLSDRPISRGEINELVGNEDLSRYYTELGPPLVMRVAISEDEMTESGFAWSSGAGPPYGVSVGTLVQVQVTIESRPPISLLIPYLKKLILS